MLIFVPESKFLYHTRWQKIWILHSSTVQILVGPKWEYGLSQEENTKQNLCSRINNTLTWPICTQYTTSHSITLSNIPILVGSKDVICLRGLIWSRLLSIINIKVHLATANLDLRPSRSPSWLRMKHFWAPMSPHVSLACKW